MEDKGFSGRANFLVDGEGYVAFAKVYGTSGVPDVEEVIEALEKLD